MVVSFKVVSFAGIVFRSVTNSEACRRDKWRSRRASFRDGGPTRTAKLKFTNGFAA